MSNPLNAVLAIDNAQVSLAGYGSLVAFVGLSAAIERDGSRDWLLRTCTGYWPRSGPLSRLILVHLLLQKKKALERAGTNRLDAVFVRSAQQSFTSLRLLEVTLVS